MQTPEPSSGRRKQELSATQTGSWPGIEPSHGSPVSNEGPTEINPSVQDAPRDTLRRDLPDTGDEVLGTRIGHYKLLQKIGEGGCGVVYMAEQEQPVRRRVALKVIKLGMDTREVVLRFEAERQALAMMEHPNIAKVFDAGTTEKGRPFFVMELVQGIRVTDYCDQNHLSTEARLELFIKVCQAVQHAHQKGIIHRDIKPSNILVTTHDEMPVPKVIDFGIAKATAGNLTQQTLFTRFEQFLGTPAYMSPEQADMGAQDIDTRSDIYSLGVVLYELLTGRTPFDSKALLERGIEELILTLRQVEPPRPSTRLSTLAGGDLGRVSQARGISSPQLRARLSGDLDWIVMKALEKDRSRRYETANGFAMDLRRHLSYEPVTAGPPSKRYRLQKFVRRNRSQVIAGSLVAAVLALGLVGTTWGLIKARQQEKQARKRLIQVEKAGVILGSIFENLDPKQIAKEERPLQAILAEKLDKAVEQLEGESIGDPLVVATMQNRFGRSLLGLGEPGKAIVVLEKAHTTLLAKLGPGHPDTLTSMNNLASAYQDAGKLNLALPLYAETLKLREAKLGPNHPDTIDSMNSLAIAYWRAKQLDKSIPLFEETRRREEAAFGKGHLDNFMIEQSLAQNYLDAGRTAEALPLLEKSFGAIKAKVGSSHPYTLTAMGNLAGAFQKVGKLDLALPLSEETLKLQKAKLGPDHPATLLAMGNLASAYQDAGKLDLAVSLSKETLELRKAKLGTDHPQTLTAMNNLATAYWHANELDKSISLFEETVKRQVAKLGTDFPETLLSRHSLARAYQTAGKPDLALPLFEETLKLMRTKLGSDDPNTLMAMGSLAGAYQTIGKLDLALPLLEEALKIMRTKFGSDHTNTLTAMGNLASAYQAAGKPDLALPQLEEMLKLQKARLGPDHPDTLAIMRMLAPAYWRVGQLDKSIPLFEEHLKRAEAKFGRDHPDTLVTVANLGVNYKDAGRLNEALPLLEEAYQALRSNVEMRWVARALAETYTRTGENAKAAAVYDESMKLMKANLGPDHPDTLQSMNDLGTCYWFAKQLDKSIPLFEEALKGREAMLGRSNLDTLVTLANLGVNYKDAGRLSEALPLLEEARQAARSNANLRWIIPALAETYARAGENAKALALRQEMLADARSELPKDSPELADLLAQSAMALLQQKEWAEAEPLARECLVIREKRFPDDWRTFNTKSLLGGALLGQKKYPEAEPLLLEGYREMKTREASIPPIGRPRITETLTRLVQLYEVVGKESEAADKRIIAFDKPEPWLIELSSQGDSHELEELIVSADEGVYLQALRLAYRAWNDSIISDARFAVCIRTLWKQAGEKSHWYADLLWMDDAFDLVEQGISCREESMTKIKTAFEALLKIEPC